MHCNHIRNRDAEKHCGSLAKAQPTVNLDFGTRLFYQCLAQLNEVFLWSYLSGSIDEKINKTFN